MPPRRSQPAAPVSKAPAKRRSKLAKEHNITADEEAEIQEAFKLFSVEDPDSKEAILRTTDVRRCLIALNAPPKDRAELGELIEIIDPDDSGWVSYDYFVAIAALKLHERGADPEAAHEEAVEAYRLFTRGEERDIDLGDLRRIARELKEEIPETVLKDMMREATGGGLAGVGLEEFQDVMRRAGVLG